MVRHIGIAVLPLQGLCRAELVVEAAHKGRAGGGHGVCMGETLSSSPPGHSRAATRLGQAEAAAAPPLSLQQDSHQPDACLHLEPAKPPVWCLLASTRVHPRRAASLLPIQAPSEAWNSLSDICRDSEIITLTDGLLLSPSLSFISVELTRYAVNFPRRMKHGASWVCLFGRRGPAHNWCCEDGPQAAPGEGRMEFVSSQ